MMLVSERKMEKTSSVVSTKTARKIVEKDRRNQMKNLYTRLFSLLPTYNPKDGLALPHQLGEAEEYIKSLQAKVEESKKKKESLVSRKRAYAYSCSASNAKATIKSPEIQVHEMGPAFSVVVAKGLEDQVMFYELIRALHREGAEVVHANFSISGDSIIQVANEKIGEPTPGSGASRISTRLKALINGSACSEHEMDLQTPLWDFDTLHDTWDSGLSRVMKCNSL